MVSGGIVKGLRETIATWYYAFRNIAAIVLMVILIYVGIRMALSTVAEERAKYQRMLFDWVVSLLLIFVMQYLAIFIIYLNNAAVEALRQYVENESVGKELLNLGLTGVLGSGFESIGCALAFCALVIITILFLVAYINRMFKVAFLIMISPLISLTYAIDKMGDGKAQAFEGWLKEFIGAVAIQPFHCILYVSFVSVSLKLIGTGEAINPLVVFSNDSNQLAASVLALLSLFFIFDGEKVVKKIFGLQDEGDKTSLAGGLVIAMAAVKNSQKVAAGARKAVNTSRAFAQNASRAVLRDRDKLRDWANDPSASKGQQLLGNLADKLDNGLGGKDGDFAKRLSEALVAPEKMMNNLHGGVDSLLHKAGGLAGGRVGRAISGFAHLYGKDGAFGRWTSGIKVTALAGAMMSLESGNGIGGAAATYKSLSQSSDEYNKGSFSKNAAAVQKLNDRQAEKEEREYRKVVSELDQDRADNAEAYDDAEAMILADSISDDPEDNPGEFDKEISNQERAVASADAEVKSLEQEIESTTRQMAADPTNDEYGPILVNQNIALRKAQAKLNAEKEELGTMQAKRDKAREFRSGTRSLTGKSEEIYNKMVKRNALAESHSRNGSTSTRAVARIHRSTDAELDAKKREIMSKILELKRKVDRAGGGDNSTTNTFTTDETDKASAISSAILQRVQTDLSSNMAYDEQTHEDFIRGQLGITDSEMFKDEFSSISSLISEYDSMLAGNMMSDYKGNFVGTGGSAELFDARIGSHSEAVNPATDTVFEATMKEIKEGKRGRRKSGSKKSH